MTQDPETAAISTGLLFAIALGAIVLTAQVVIAWLRQRKRKVDPYEQIGPIIHPADDIGDFDSWPELEQYLEQRPGLREQYERDAMAHREGRR